MVQVLVTNKPTWEIDELIKQGILRRSSPTGEDEFKMLSQIGMSIAQRTNRCDQRLDIRQIPQGSNVRETQWSISRRSHSILEVVRVEAIGNAREDAGPVR